VCKGRLAQQALNHFDVVVEAGPQSWVGRYCRGINHLHWPRALLHNDAAAADLEAAAALQEKRGDVRPHYQRIYVAWGDALTKAGEPDEARTAWRKGLALFPAASDLKARLAITDDKALLRFVEAERSLEKPIDSDLSFLDREL
jgi:tetratricopeptide (TPR) repeat protein